MPDAALPPGVTMRTVDTLLDVGADTWDGLAAHGPLQQGFGYLRTVETVPGIDVRYVLAVGGDGAALGAVPLYLPGSVAGPRAPVSTLLSHLPMADESPESWRSAIYTGAAHGYRSGVLVDGSLSPSDRSAVLAGLLDAVQAERVRVGAAAVLHRHLIDGEQVVLGRGVPLIQDAEATLHLSGDNWNDYLEALPARRRYAVRRDLDTFARSGLRSSRGRLGDVWRAAAALSAQVFARYGRADAGPQRLARYRRIVEHWSDDLEVVLVHAGADLIGFSSVVPWGEDLYALDYGLDYERAGDHGEYFHLMFYEPIRIAYEKGLRRVQLGRGSLEAKTRRGARLHPLWTVVDGSAPAPEEGDRWNAEARQRLGLTPESKAEAA